MIIRERDKTLYTLQDTSISGVSSSFACGCGEYVTFFGWSVHHVLILFPSMFCIVTQSTRNHCKYTKKECSSSWWLLTICFWLYSFGPSSFCPPYPAGSAISVYRVLTGPCSAIYHLSQMVDLHSLNEESTSAVSLMYPVFVCGAYLASVTPHTQPL